MKHGTLTLNGVKPEPHELDTILSFTNLDKDIELIVPSNTPKTQRPDFYMDGLAWELSLPAKIIIVLLKEYFTQRCSKLKTLFLISAGYIMAVKPPSIS